MTDIALDEKALAAPTGWLDISDEAVSGKRILLLWEPAGGLDEHVELGWFCQSAAGWVNTYGKPFSSAPDKWAPLAPFAVSSPSQVAPANPAQVTEALKVAEQAFKEIRLLLVKCLDEPERSAFWKAVRGRDAMRAALTAAIGAGGQAVALEKRPVAFRVKDFADGWILFHDEEKALTEADATGAIIQGLYIREALPSMEGVTKVDDGYLHEWIDADGEHHKYVHPTNLSALSQRHPADERVVEAMELAEEAEKTAVFWGAEANKAMLQGDHDEAKRCLARAKRHSILAVRLRAKEGRNNG